MPSRPSKRLQTFRNPAPRRDYRIHVEIPEFTCLCPMTGQPDFATLVLDYVPDRACVELKSLKLYVWSYRNEGAFHEAVTNRIVGDLARALAPRYLRLEARFNGNDGVLQGLDLRRGDRFLETYYADRRYNVFAIFDAVTDQFKGWYCNITRPARIEDGHVHFDDLALDLLVLPDGTMHVLDEDEFEQIDLGEAERVAARASLEELRRLAQVRAGPFDPASTVIPPLPGGAPDEESL